MSRILVVSRNPSVAMALALQDYDVLDRRPDPGQAWRDEIAGVDLILLDAGACSLAAEIVIDLRRTGHGLPVVLTRDDDPGWDDLQRRTLPAVGFIERPLSRLTVVQAVHAALRAGPIPPEARITTLPVAATQPASANGGQVLQPAASPPVAQPTLHVMPPAAPKRPATDRAPPGHEAATLRDRDWLIDRLLEQLGDPSGVRETAEVVLAEAQERAGAEAGCLLLPDGAQWSVCAAMGTRVLENRLRLDPRHWLVEEVITRQHGVLVADSDITRSRLAGAPLAHWRHLLAAPVDELAGMILVARDRGAFTERDLVAVLAVADEARPLLLSALRLRKLARTLVEYAEEEP